MAQFVDQARQAIMAEGGRMTAQRQIILEVIDTSHEHLTADDITDRAQQRDRNINPSTVYRTLSFLKEHNLIKAQYYDQDNHREIFEPTPQIEHYHFTCSHCGQVIEFESPHVPALRRQLQNDYGVEITTACLYLTGICADCKDKQTQQGRR